MNDEERSEASGYATLTNVLMPKEVRKEIKETFKSLEETLSEPDYLSSVSTAIKLKELLAKAKSFASDFCQAGPLCGTGLGLDIENAISAIDALCFAVEKKEADDTLREFYAKALRMLTAVNGGLKGWVG